MEDGANLDKIKKEKELELQDAQLDKELAKAGLRYAASQERLVAPGAETKQPETKLEELKRKIKEKEIVLLEVKIKQTRAENELIEIKKKKELELLDAQLEKELAKSGRTHSMLGLTPGEPLMGPRARIRQPETRLEELERKTQEKKIAILEVKTRRAQAEKHEILHERERARLREERPGCLWLILWSSFWTIIAAILINTPLNWIIFPGACFLAWWAHKRGSEGE